MANNYLQFSQVVENLTLNEAKWMKDYIDKLEDDDDNSWLGFDYAFEDSATTLWIFTIESGDPNKVAEFMHEFLKKFRPKEVFVMNWCDCCSKPRIEEFGGGAIVVSAKEILEWNSYAWSDEMASQMKDDLS